MEKTMLKSFICALVLLFTLPSCGASKSPSSSQNAKTTYLFVITTDDGMIQQANDGTYQLIVDHGAVPKVLAFSNRPFRLVKNETGETLQSIWAEGSNSFAQDPPNAVVIINQQVQTIVILNMNIEGDQTVFNIRADGPQSLVEMSGPMQIFVDGNSGVLNKNACGLSC